MRLLASSSVHTLVIEARAKLGMTQREFSDAVESSVRTVARWEDRASSPLPPQLHAEGLGASSPAFDRVRVALRAAFGHARDLCLDPGDVAEALAPATLAPSDVGAPAKPPALSVPKQPPETAASLETARTARRASRRLRKRK